MAVTEENRELFTQLRDLTDEWGLNTVLEALADVCDENRDSGKSPGAGFWERAKREIDAARQKSTT